MVRKKIAGTIVSIVFLAGNCLASAPEEQPEGSKVERSKVFASRLQKKKMFARRKETKSLMDKIVEKLTRQFNSDKIVEKLTEKINMDEIVTKAVEKIVDQNSQGEKERQSERKLNPFKTVDEVSKYVEHIDWENIEEENMIGRIDATKRYALGTAIPFYIYGRIGDGGREVWNKAKLLEILHVIKKNEVFRGRIVDRCNEIIRQDCLDDFEDGLKEFGYAKLLFLSQCNEWNESDGMYALKSQYNEEVVKEAKGRLYNLGRRGGDAEKDKARMLVNNLKKADLIDNN